jgi:uncharacterized protein YecT (DUF1311 family)
LLIIGPPYLTRAEAFAKDAKIDFAFSEALQGRQVTIGDLVAHAMGVGSLAQMLSVFTTLLGSDFSDRLSGAEKVEDGEFTAAVLRNPDQTLRALDRLFQVRHIVVHELPAKTPYSEDEINDFLDAAMDFVVAAEDHLTFELEGVVPLTQSEMNAHAFAELEREREMLAQLLGQVEQLEDVDPSLLNTTQAAWTVFAEAEARLHANTVAGGSLEPLVRYSRLAELTRERTGHLTSWTKRAEE